VAALCPPRRSPASPAATAARHPAETIGEDSAARLAVKAKPYRRHSALLALRSAPALTAALAAALQMSPISAGAGPHRPSRLDSAPCKRAWDRIWWTPRALFSS
jgi:hypothetical protein